MGLLDEFNRKMYKIICYANILKLERGGGEKNKITRVKRDIKVLLDSKKEVK